MWYLQFLRVLNNQLPSQFSLVSPSFQPTAIMNSKNDPSAHGVPLSHDKSVAGIYEKYDIIRETVYGGALEELLRPPVKSIGYRTETQIQLMRKMRYVSNKLNLTQVGNNKHERKKRLIQSSTPDYESAVTILLDSFEITRSHVWDDDFRRKMNFLLR